MVAKTLVWTALLTLAAATPALACAGKTVLLKDDFSRADPAWDTNAQVTVDRGRMRITGSAGHITSVLYKGKAYDKADICIDVTVPDPSEPDQQGSGDLIFDARNEGDFYALWVTPAKGTAAVVRRLNGDWLTVVAFRSFNAIKGQSGETNRLRLTLDGAHATAYVNDEKFAGFRINAAEGGGFVGLAVAGGDAAPATWEFHNLTVTDVP